MTVRRKKGEMPKTEFGPKRMNLNDPALLPLYFSKIPSSGIQDIPSL
jgi:hypothetical protein